MFQRFFTELRAARVPVTGSATRRMANVSPKTPATLVVAVAVVCAFASEDSEARRPPPPGYQSIESAVSQSAGYWAREPGQHVAYNTVTGLRCPPSVGAFQIARLSNAFERQFQSAHCIYADIDGRMFSVSRYPRQTSMDAEICDGSSRYDEHLSVLASCILNGEMVTSVVSDASRPPTEAERVFVAGLFQATGNL